MVYYDLLIKQALKLDAYIHINPLTAGAEYIRVLPILLAR